jgi:four helix bundle protein
MMDDGAGLGTAVILLSYALFGLPQFGSSNSSWSMPGSTVLTSNSDYSRTMIDRTMRFAEGVFRMCRAIPRTFEGRHVSGQLFRSSSSVAANYRAARRARSKKEFAAKIGVVVEDADESLFWLEFAIRVKLLTGPSVAVLRSEARELVAILTATRHTVMTRLRATRGPA